MKDKATEFLSNNGTPPVLRDIIPMDKVSGLLINGHWNVVGQTASSTLILDLEYWGHGFLVRLKHGCCEFYNFNQISGYAWKEDVTHEINLTLQGGAGDE
jgi:hypothetical protein